MTRAMSFVQPTVSRAFDAVKSAAARVGLPADLFRSDVARSAVAGAVLFGLAGAGRSASGLVEPLRIGAAAAGTQVRIDWGYGWMAAAVVGMFVGAVVGAGVTYLARLKFPRLSAARVLLLVGAMGGLAAGVTWGGEVARDRMFHMQAQQLKTQPLPVKAGTPFSVENGQIRVSGSFTRSINFPLLAFMTAAGTLLGALAARGLAEVPPFRAAAGGEAWSATGASKESNGAATQPRQTRRAA